MIHELKIELAKDTPLTPEAFEEFLTTKCYFRRNGRDLEKLYSLGKDLRESLVFKVRLEENGVIGSWQLFENSRAGTFVEATGKTTRLFAETIKWAERLKDVSMILRDDLKDIEKFVLKAS